MATKIYRFNRLLHKWMGLVLSLQLFFWIGGGLVMASLDIDEVHGDHLHRVQNDLLPAASYTFPLQGIIAKQRVQQVSFISIQQEPVYKIKTDKYAYFSAVDGRAMPMLNEDQIGNIARALFTRQDTITNLQLLSDLPLEARPLKPPVWRIDFSDSDNTSFYLHPISGELLRVRSDVWRLFDFVWMLHIMDYDERDDFNHPLLIIFALSALVFTLTGLVMLYQMLFVLRARKRPSR